MPTNPHSPLTKADLATVDKALAELKELREALIRARQAGIDVADQEQRAKALEDRLLALKRAYGSVT